MNRMHYTSHPTLIGSSMYTQKTGQALQPSVDTTMRRTCSKDGKSNNTKSASALSNR